MPEITDLPTLPPKWHGADYSARQIAAIRERVADASFGPERPVVTWLLEEIDWLGQQVVGHGPAATQWAVGSAPPVRCQRLPPEPLDTNSQPCVRSHARIWAAVGSGLDLSAAGSGMPRAFTASQMASAISGVLAMPTHSCCAQSASRSPPQR